MGEVGAATSEHPTSDEIKENGEINGNRDPDQPVVTKVVSLRRTKASSESEYDDNSQTSQPISSNGQTEGEGDDTSQDLGAETEESRPEVVRVDSELHDTVESMEVDDDDDRSNKSRTSGENGKDPLEDGMNVGNDDDSKSKSEIMDVDASTNGHRMTQKAYNEVIDDDSDKPVSINSDSDNEDSMHQPSQHVTADSVDGNSKSNDAVSNGSNARKQNGDCDGDVTILSDKEEDCVVIDDEDGDTNTSNPTSHNKLEAEDLSPRRSSRARKSMLPQDISTIDDDDDIEEIIDDPLNIAAKKPRLSINQSLQQNSFQGQIPIVQPPQKSLLASNQNSATKEPTLVIIDTNTLMNRSANASIPGSPVTPKAVNNAYSVIPTGITPTGITPTNIPYNSSPRSVLNPVAATANLISKTAPPPLAPVTPLLPALTDDMFVLEAPSFIVPYIYEKPPPENLGDIVKELEAKIKEMRKSLGEEEVSKAEEEPIPATTADSTDKKAEAASEASKKKKSKRKGPDDDEEWDEVNSSTDDEASDEEQKTKVLIKEVKSDIEMIKEHIIVPSTKDDLTGSSGIAGSQTDPKKSENYFENPLGKFFMNIGVNLVQEYVQTDLLRQQKKKRDREGKPSPSTQMAINSLMKNLELSKENNKPYKFEMKRCEYCSFKSESALSMAHHYETPHMRNYVYKCNFCSYETRPPHDILYHMEAIHNIKGRMEKAPMYHACPNCPFEDNGKSKLARHAVACAKKFRPEINLNPPIDWEPPAKIPRIKPKHGLVGTATAYQAMTAQQQKNLALANQRVQAANNINPININNLSVAAQTAAMRARGGRPQQMPTAASASVLKTAGSAAALRTSMSPGMVMPNNYQLSAAAIAAATNKFMPTPNAGGRSLLTNSSNASVTIQNTMGLKPGIKPSQQPSISITPVPRQSSATYPSVSKLESMVKPGQNPAGGKTAFVVCEICDGYIKDLDQLRNHMQWIHKVKIHPKMIYNRPPLNCQKCQYRFFTDQGLERHLLGSHGLVTSSMQEAANKGKDAGRCPVCGRVYQWKLLNHVSRDHNMTLKPAHLSYKCTVCTATFGMYKQFESHVYSAHSTVAKKALDNKNKPQQPGASGAAAPMRNSLGGGDSLLKPLKINDEITIIPQPTGNKGAQKPIEIESHVIGE